MNTNVGHNHYRIAGIRPWESEGTDAVPQEIRTFFEGKEVDMDDLRALTASFGAEFESAVEGAACYGAVIRWHGHRYDLELQPISAR